MLHSPGYSKYFCSTICRQLTTVTQCIILTLASINTGTIITCWTITGILTSVSPVYSVDSPVHQRAASLLSLLGDWSSAPALSGLRELTSEQRPEQHSLSLWLYSLTAYRVAHDLSEHTTTLWWCKGEMLAMFSPSLWAHTSTICSSPLWSYLFNWY